MRVPIGEGGNGATSTVSAGGMATVVVDFPVAAPVTDLIALTEDELKRIMTQLCVILGADGSLHVHGIPVTVADDLRTAVARVAANAGTQRLASLVGRGRPLSTVDLQAVNVAARSAVQRAFGEVAYAA